MNREAAAVHMMLKMGIDPYETAEWTMDMIYRTEDETRGMFSPVRHRQCGKVHDCGPVEVIARYADCTLWKCPNCGGTCDDRPIGWGGNVEKLY